MPYVKRKKPTVVRVPYVRKFDISPNQQNFIDHYHSKESFSVEAGPGSGKTTTGSITFNEFLMPGRSHFCTSFSNAIVNTLASVMPPEVFCKGVHASGLAAVTKEFGRPKVDGRKVGSIIKEQVVNPFNEHDPKKKAAAFELYNQIEALVHMTKVCNVAYENDDAILEMANARGLDLGDDPDRTLISAQLVLLESFKQTHIVDFDDMLRFPVEFDLKLPKYDVVFVDEQQDFSDVMIELVSRMVGEQYIGIGDRYQAIMGFSGAGLNSVDNIVAHYDCPEIPLDVCYRCAKNIVLQAQKINPELKPFEGSEDGTVSTVEDSELIDLLQPGDVHIARRNATNVAGCFAAMRKGKAAMIKGKDVGTILSRFLQKLGGHTIKELEERLDRWETKERERLAKRNSPQAIEAMENKVACSQFFIEQAIINNGELDWIHKRIGEMFGDKLPDDCIHFMTGHSSKGLEYDRVFIAQHPKFRLSYKGMTPDDHVQERNVDFVAQTRAKKELYLGNVPEE